jgi:hypothetical protein
LLAVGGYADVTLDLHRVRWESFGHPRVGVVQATPASRPLIAAFVSVQRRVRAGGNCI